MGDGTPASSVARTDDGRVESVDYTTGRVVTANSPKAAVRQNRKAELGVYGRNNRKQPRVKLNKKETKAATENGRDDYNSFVARYEDGPVSKSGYAAMTNNPTESPELKKDAISRAKEQKAKRIANKKGR